MTDRFVGIPALEEGPAAAQIQSLRGTWWIRGCSAKSVANGIHVRFEGPGWYFIDRRDGDFELHQQVTFTLGIELEGTPNLSVEKGIATLRFETKTTPQVQLDIDRDLNIHATSTWGALVSLMPMLSVRERAAQRLSSLAVTALRAKLREGASATYTLSSGQGAVSLGKLAAGQTPETAFTDAIPWLVNERVLLPPSATQVLGPIDSGPARLDARVEQAEGLSYRSVCQADMPAAYNANTSGHLERLPPPAPAHGTLRGVGEHSAILRAEDCKFFIVVSTLGESTTVAALRVRG